MEKVLLLLCLVGTVQCLMSEIHHVLTKRQESDLIDFNQQCSTVFSGMDVKCLTNILSLVESYKTIEKAAVSSWASQCQGSIYDCLSSPDGDTNQVIQYFKTLLPQIKALCADGCMVPIIELIHSCLKPEALARIGISRSEMEDIFDLVCIQESRTDSGQEGEYCMIKAMSTALWMYEANKIQRCNLDSIDLTTCGSTDDSTCQCGTNCTRMIKSASGQMGCCMGTLLELEKAFNVSHPDDPNLLNPGNQLFKLCDVTVEESCKTSKAVIAEQEQIYGHCSSAVASNDDSECIKLEKEVHKDYLLDMQNISKQCENFKNINQCKDPHVTFPLSSDLLEVITKLNNHCDECKAELSGIRDNCTVFLPHEAKMVFGMMCLQNTDMEHCGPRIIVYESEQGRLNLNSNPCFKGVMPKVQNTCSVECAREVDMMNRYSVLNCFDALMSYTEAPAVEWELWHQHCVKNPNVTIHNKINVTMTWAEATTIASGSKDVIIKTVAYTVVGTVLVAFVIVGVVVILYKKQMIMNMFGYTTFHDGDDNGLISEVHMEDTMGSDRGENYYD